MSEVQTSLSLIVGEKERRGKRERVGSIVRLSLCVSGDLEFIPFLSFPLVSTHWSNSVICITPSSFTYSEMLSTSGMKAALLFPSLRSSLSSTSPSSSFRAFAAAAKIKVDNPVVSMIAMLVCMTIQWESNEQKKTVSATSKS